LNREHATAVLSPWCKISQNDISVALGISEAFPKEENLTKINLATPDDPGRFVHFGGVIGDPRINWHGQLPFPLSEDNLDGIDAVLVTDEYFYDRRACIATCKLKGIPVFHVLDGIVRWKNLFENPRSSVATNGSPFMRPLISDKTFVMGDFQASILRWLGNQNLCISGLPRFASHVPANCVHGKQNNPSLLLASSNSPWYTAAQKEFFIPRFQKLINVLRRDCSDLNVKFNGRFSTLVKWENVDPSWLGPHPPFREQLAQCSALITTPSTIALEAMILGVPTLVFDPWADPALLQSAWTAHDADTVSALLPSLLSPSPERAKLQDAFRSFQVRDSRQSVEIIVDTIIREVMQRKHGVVGSTPIDLETCLNGAAVPIGNATDWTLNSTHVIGLVQTIPQLVYMLHTNVARASELKRYAETVELYQRPLWSVLAKKIRSFLSKRRSARNGIHDQFND
jgi:hypothetical protein